MPNTKMKIIVDSTSDIPEEFVKKYDIDIVPVYIQLDNKMYADRFELQASDFYNVLRNADKLPTTSAPPPKDFWEKITNSLKEYSSIFIITLTSKLSATFQSAKIAASRMKNVKVYLLDSKFGSGVTTLLSIAAAKLSRKGVPEEEIVEKIEKLRDESILLGFVDNLENLKKSGRISNLKYFVATITNAKPILELREGILEAIGKASGKQKAIRKVISSIMDKVMKDKKYDIMITHGDDIETAEFLMKKLEKKLPIREKFISHLTPALGVHLGVGTVVVSLVPTID
jgi:DegV family protein with EDD domain